MQPNSWYQTNLEVPDNTRQNCKKVCKQDMDGMLQWSVSTYALLYCMVDVFFDFQSRRCVLKGPLSQIRLEKTIKQHQQILTEALPNYVIHNVLQT